MFFDFDLWKYKRLITVSHTTTTSKAIFLYNYFHIGLLDANDFHTEKLKAIDKLLSGKF